MERIIKLEYPENEFGYTPQINIFLEILLIKAF